MSTLAGLGQGVVTFGTQIPRAMAGGVRDALVETAQGVDAVADWLNENVADLRVGEGKDPLEAALEDPLKGLPGEAAIKAIPEPDTVAGKALKGFTQFLTGFIPAARVAGLGRAATVAGQMGSSAVAGGITDFTVFDAQSSRLADWWKSAGLPENALTEFLASDPSDGEIEGRLKNVLEGAALGTITDGVLMAAKTLRSWRSARAGVEPAVDPSAQIAIKRGEAIERDIATLGDPTAPLVAVRETPSPKVVADVTEGVDTGAAARGIVAASELRQRDAAGNLLQSPRGAPAEPSSEVFINFARIDTTDDIKAVLGEVATAFKVEVAEAQRGVRTWKQTALSSDELDAWKVINERGAGQALNAEQLNAARELWVQSGRKLIETAQAAAGGSEGSTFAFAKMLSVHAAVQNEFFAARTEAARALNILRRPVGAVELRGMQLDQAMSAMGDPKALQDLAQTISVTPMSKVSEVARRSLGARTASGLYEAWINGLLTNPKTHIVNAMSNTAVIGQSLVERAVAGRISRALGTQGGVEVGEAAISTHALLETTKDMIRYAGYRARVAVGQPPAVAVPNPMDNPATLLGASKATEARVPAISAEAFNISRNSPAGHFMNALGSMVRVPGAALDSADRFFKTFGYRAELHASSYRKAMNEAASGRIPPERFQERLAELLDNPSPEITLDAVNLAQTQTFTNKPGAIGDFIMYGRRKIPPIQVVLPFVRTPLNIARYTFERSPIAFAVGQWRKDIGAGGARRDLALARMSTGSFIFAAMVDLAMSGHLNGAGPQDVQERQGERRGGEPPYTAKVGDLRIAYQRLDPFGSHLGYAADLVELLANSEYDENDTKTVEEVAAAGIASVIGNVMNKSYLSGFSDFMQMFNPIMGGYYAEQYAQGLASSLIPSVVGEVERQTDPVMREARSMLDGMRAKVPVLSTGLPPQRDRWGKERKYEGAFGKAFDIVSPINVTRADAEPIDRELMDKGIEVSMPKRVVSFSRGRGQTQRIDLDRHPGAYSRYLELAGQEVTDPATGMTLLDTLNRTVEGKHPIYGQVYQLRNDDGKETWIKKQISSFEERARAQLLQEFPSLRGELEDKIRRESGNDPIMRMQ